MTRLRALFIGVDIGTTEIKAALFDDAGALIRERSRPNPAVRHRGWDGLDPVAIFVAVKELVRGVAEGRGDGVRGIAFASMAETVIPVDDDGPLMEGICWYETCSISHYEALCRSVSKEDIRRRCALWPSWIYSASKIMKVRDEYPDVWSRTKFFLDVSGFMAFMFTGEAGFDATIACRTMLLDCAGAEWSQPLLEAAGLDASRLPSPIRYPGEPWGDGLKRDSADELGLPAGIAVSTGGQDHIAAAAGAGVSDPSTAMISIGTSAAFYSPASRDVFSKEPFLGRPFLAGGYSAFPGGGYVLTGLPAGGFCMDWFIHKVLGRDYGWLDEMELSRTDALFLPNLRAMTEGLPAGGFTRLSDKDTGATLFQSIMESLAFECRYTLTEAFEAKEMPGGFREVVMLGGGALNGVFTKIVAHALARPIKIHGWPRTAAAFGAALAAGLAAGHFKTWQEATALARFGDTIFPEDEDLSAYLNEKYVRHLDIFRAIERNR